MPSRQPGRILATSSRGMNGEKVAYFSDRPPAHHEYVDAGFAFRGGCGCPRDKTGWQDCAVSRGNMTYQKKVENLYDLHPRASSPTTTSRSAPHHHEPDDPGRACRVISQAMARAMLAPLIITRRWLRARSCRSPPSTRPRFSS